MCEVAQAAAAAAAAPFRFAPESDYGANKGLDIARNRLEQVKKQFPWISYADLWTLASVVAIESMGGGQDNMHHLHKPLAAAGT